MAVIEESLISLLSLFSGHSSNEVSLSDALQTASILFKQSSTRLGEKRVFLFTNEDDPFPNDDRAKRAAVLRAIDLKVSN